MSRDPDLESWLVLSMLPASPAALTRSLEHFGSPAALLAAADNGFADTPAARRALGTALRRHPSRAALDTAWRWLDCPGHCLLTLEDERYPALLRRIACPPPVLFVDGDPAALAAVTLAIVGSRRPTAGGVRNARTLAAELSRAGLLIASGLASGIDTAAHLGALDAEGPTVAVLGRGPDGVYPRANRELAARIAESGALVSEFPPGTPPRREHFPRRNRVIAGLAVGVVVVEAALRSGSLITARLALEENREVFAVPGSIHSPMSHGCHRLIREGAVLVEGAADVLAELGSGLRTGPAPCPQGPAHQPAPAAGAPDGLEAEARIVLDTMGYEPVTIDALVASSGLTPEQVSSILFLLELRGLVEPCHGGSYLRIA